MTWENDSHNQTSIFKHICDITEIDISAVMRMSPNSDDIGYSDTGNSPNRLQWQISQNDNQLK